MEDQRRHRFLEENSAVVRADWFPSEEECAGLADLRAEHERLVTVVAGEIKAAGDTGRKRRAELEAQRAERERAFLDGKRKPESAPAVTVTEDAVAEAFARADAARDAVQSFAKQAIAEVTERAPALLDGLGEIVQQAEAKREEARTLLDEAQQMELGTKRLRNWLARTTGESVLGLYPFGQLPLPTPDPESQMTVADLHAAMQPHVDFTEAIEDDLEPIEEIGVEDDPAPVAPWEVKI